ncbi:13235_t:CDS:2, partial [Racocetra fulgida]
TYKDMTTVPRKQPQLLLHGRISHNVLATLAASASRSIEEVGGMKQYFRNLFLTFKFQVVGQGTGCFQEGEKITAVLCLPFFMPSANNGYFYVSYQYQIFFYFDSHFNSIIALIPIKSVKYLLLLGNLQISQLLDISPILEIKLRTANIPTFSLPVSVPSSPQKTYHQSFIEIDEEITILFKGGKVVSIDGKSLWTVLRICINSGNVGIPDTPTTTGGSTSFAYKKWRFEGQEAVLDVVSCGPSHNTISDILDQSLSSSASTALFPFQATARYIAVGSNPMLSYYATTDSSRPFYLAVSIASMVASKVTNAVFSLAKTLLTATGTIQTAGSDGGPSMANIAPATSIPLVTLVDVEEGEIIAMYKGIRNAQCGWVEAMDENETEEDCTSPNQKHKKRSASKRITLFLVIYSPIRGVVEIHHMRHGTRVGNFSIGQGWNLITTASAPLGTSMCAGLSFYERGGRRGYRNAGLAKCFLIDPQGEIKRVHVPFECAVK